MQQIFCVSLRCAGWFKVRELPCLCFEVTRLFGSQPRPLMRSLNSDQQQIKGRQDDDVKDVYAGVYH